MKHDHLLGWSEAPRLAAMFYDAAIFDRDLAQVQQSMKVMQSLMQDALADLQEYMPLLACYDPTKRWWPCIRPI